MYRRIIKRGLDFAVLALTAPFALTIVLVVGAAVWWKMGLPVFFRQTRVGRDERLFDLVKFRTMSEVRGGDGELLPEERRLTRFGRFLRAASVDEVPTLWNVLRGDMTLIGPRPLLVGYLRHYNATQRRRHEVNPGITGWAQVNGRNAISWEQKFSYDVWYVDNVSFWLDARIVALTIAKVLRRTDISPPGIETMPPFTGSGDERR